MVGQHTILHNKRPFAEYSPKVDIGAIAAKAHFEPLSYLSRYM